MISRGVTRFLGHNHQLSRLYTQLDICKGSPRPPAWADAMLGEHEEKSSSLLGASTSVKVPYWEHHVFHLWAISITPYWWKVIHCVCKQEKSVICKPSWVTKKRVKNHPLNFTPSFLLTYRPIPCARLGAATLSGLWLSDGLITLLPSFPASVNHQGACEAQGA